MRRFRHIYVFLHSAILQCIGRNCHRHYFLLPASSYGRQGQRGETFNVHFVRSVYSEVYLPVMLFEYWVGSDEIFKILFVEKSD